jgi:hypothetical protein
MNQLKLLCFITLLFTVTVLDARPGAHCDKCCEKSGCIQYCDSSAGRYVCGDGSYSACYCTRHAVMDLQKISGCCVWQGGVMTIEPASRLVICNDGSVSEICSIQHPVAAVSLW